MFGSKFEERMSLWRKLRDSLETATDPIQNAIDFYNQAPTCKLSADPYNYNSWLGPWELLEKNNYCSFVKILAICYTLQLTDCLSQAKYEIHITRDNDTSETYYLLYVDDIVIGFNKDTYVHKDTLPLSLYSECVHTMPAQQ